MLVYLAGPLFTPYERGHIDACAAVLRADGFEVFVPHEHELAAGASSPQRIFEQDLAGLADADAVLAVLDGPTVDDGTACEIGIFWAQMQTAPAKKGIVGLRTDLRAVLGDGERLNLFVEGCVTASGGAVVHSLDDALALLRGWR